MVPLSPRLALPLFPGVPGGPELLVVLLLLVALFGLPVVVAVLGWRHLRGDGRVEELEARVRELESELAETDVDDTDPETDSESGSESGSDSRTERDADATDDGRSR